MKKIDFLFLILGSIFSLIPIYSIVGWWYLCFQYSDLSQPETVKIYDAQISLNLFSNRYYDSFFIILCGLISCGLLYMSYLNSAHNEGITNKIKLGLLYTSVLFTFLKIFGLM